MKEKGLERVCKPLLESNAQPSPPKQSVKFECQTQPELLRNSLRSA